MGRPRATPAREWDQVSLRLPPGMRDQINEIAARNGRSANAEIVARLQATLAGDDSLSIEAVRQVVREELRSALKR